MGGQHFAMGVDVDALALSLLQQPLEIVQVMAGDDDERPLFHLQRYGGGGGCAKGLGVGPVKQFHAGQIVLADLHYDGQQLVHAPVLADGEQGPGKEGVDLLAAIAQHVRVPGIGGHTPNAEQDQGFEGADVLVGVPELFHVVVVISTAGLSAAYAVGHQSLLFRVDLIDQRGDGLRVKADVGDGGEQTFDHEVMGGLGGRGIAVHRPGQPDQCAGQRVLKLRHLRGLATHACLASAADTARGLLALETKHFICHG